MIDTAQIALGQAESVLYLEYLNLYKTYLIRSTSSYYYWNLRAFRHNCELYKSAGEYLKKKLEK